mmetsp:Transcript_79472/g.140595  ORF Transcript_79472/g.140595 Transcript_79472/m.140595 type:complete len:95 (-) Transcript_79472:354-638(-)
MSLSRVAVSFVNHAEFDIEVEFVSICKRGTPRSAEPSCTGSHLAPALLVGTPVLAKELQYSCNTEPISGIGDTELKGIPVTNTVSHPCVVPDAE